MLDGAIESFLADRDVEAGFAEGVRQRSERVRVERPGRQRAAARGKVARSGGTSELLAETSKLREEVVAGKEAARKESRCSLRRIPGAEMLDDGLRVDATLGSWANSRIVGERSRRLAAARSSWRMSSSV